MNSGGRSSARCPTMGIPSTERLAGERRQKHYRVGEGAARARARWLFDDPSAHRARSSNWRGVGPPSRHVLELVDERLEQVCAFGEGREFVVGQRQRLL